MPRKTKPKPEGGAISGISRRALISAVSTGILSTAIVGCTDKLSVPQASEAPPLLPRLAIPPVSPSSDMPAPRAEGVDGESTVAAPAPAEILQRLAGLRATLWGLDLPGILTRTGAPVIALTFDACGGPGGSGFDVNLIETLRRLRIPATLFLNARWIDANASASKELADDPLFEIANHGMAHVPLSTTGRSAYGIPGTASLKAALDEVSAGAEAIAALTGRPAPWFRTGTAFYDDIAVQAVRAMGLVPVNFSVNSDGGATFPPSTVAAQLAGTRAGDIVIGHMNQPQSGTWAGYATALPRLVAKGAKFATLSGTGTPSRVASRLR